MKQVAFVGIGALSGTLALAAAGHADTRVEAEGATKLHLKTNGSDRVTVTDAGKVGVGVTGPGTIFHIRTPSYDGLLVETTDSTTVSTPLLNLKNPYRVWRIANAAGIVAGEGHFDIQDGTADVSRLSIDHSGNVGIGTIFPSDRLDVRGDIRVGTGSTGCVKDADGTVISGTCSSDRRLKTKIKPFDKSLDKIAKLQPVNFDWRADEFPDRKLGKKTSWGLVAQEVETVFPEMVTQDEKGMKAVQYHKLPMLMLQGMRELKAENDALKKRLEALEGARK